MNATVRTTMTASLPHHIPAGQSRHADVAPFTRPVAGGALRFGAGADNGYVHVTAYGVGVPARCRPESTAPTAGGTALEVVVACTAITGGAAQPVNSQWTLSYTNRAGLHHAAYLPAAYATTTGDPANPTVDRRHSWASNDETPAITRLGPGTYRLT